jgi:CubicO group peptidase (beta-lactamase class C family)
MPFAHLRVRPAVRTIFALALLALCFGLRGAYAAPAPVPSAAPDFAAIDAYVEAQMREQRIPGLALGIVQGDQVVHLRGFGVADPAGAPVTPQTTFSIGSLTKSFTALAVMQLAEARRLDLDTPVQRYLTWFQLADPDASARITLRHLLNHASGLPRDIDAPGPGADGLAPDPLSWMPSALRTVQLERPVGTYGYSNLGYQVLALVIQQAAGQPYEAYVREHIFAPLAMRQSFGSIQEAAPHQMAAGYHYWFGWPAAPGMPPYRRGPGNGGLFSSAEDMARYLIVHLNDGRLGQTALLSPEGVAALHRPAVARPGGHYAMGWGVQTGGTTLLAHSGQSYNYFARMVLVPERRWGVVVLQNSQYTVRILTDNQSQDAIADGVVSMLLGQPPAERPANLRFGLVYAVLALLVVWQIAGIVRSVRRLHRWRSDPESRPRGLWGAARQVGLPLALGLAWAGLTLVMLPLAVGQLAMTAYEIPDITYTLLASGAVALGWGVARAVWAARLLRQTPARR